MKSLSRSFCWCQLLLLLLLTGGTSTAESWQTKAPGLSVKSYQQNRVSFSWIRWDPQTVKAQHGFSQDLGFPKGMKIKDFIDRKPCLAAINSSYFSPSYQPLGLLLDEERLFNRHLSPSSLLSGVVVIDKNAKPAMWSSKVFEIYQGDQFAIQSGPRLISRGSIVLGLHDGRAKARSVLAHDGRFLYLIYADALSLKQLAQHLDEAKGVQLKDALNLDGGTSSQIWWKGLKQPRKPWPSKKVSNFIYLTPR